MLPLLISVLHALGGSLSEDGWLARIGLGYGKYDYDTASVAGQKVRADVGLADIMIGYQKHFQKTRLTGYLGVDYANHDLSPRDPSNDVDGTETGVKGQVEMLHQFNDITTLNFIGSTSSAYNSYYVNSLVTRSFGNVSIGPEVTFLGSESFDQRRLGLHASVHSVLPFAVSFSVGQAWVSRRGDDSPYVGVGFSNTF